MSHEDTHYYRPPTPITLKLNATVPQGDSTSLNELLAALYAAVESVHGVQCFEAIVSPVEEWSP